MTWDDVVRLGREFPGGELSTSYGRPSLKVRGKLLTRLRVEDDSLVLLDVGFDEREFLIEAEPRVFHTTPHYKDYPSVLARLGAVAPDVVRAMLTRRWRNVAPKRLIAAYDSETRA